MLSDIEIAQKAEIRPIQEIAAKLGIPEEELMPYGNYKAKVSLGFFQQVKKRPQGKLVLVTGISPTAAGEGKSTVTVGLGDGLRLAGKKSVICLREPSLGPCFGIKGGAAGGGYSQVIPMEDINLHFTGDIHAVTTAHNLLAAMLDNHIQQGNQLGFDVRRIHWRRVLDINDRALRKTIVGLGGTANSIPRETGFDISVASEVMAILCLAEDLHDLRHRFGEIVIGETRGGKELIRAKEIKAHGAMAALLKDAMAPNLVQTLEGTPAFVHGGPFANIAHGCNSVVATKMALGLGEYTITEAGFGADLGAEKFFNIKCRMAGLRPDAVVIVATIRALKMHGGVNKKELAGENPGAVEKGMVNLEQHIENLRLFGVEVVVTLNKFENDTQAEIQIVKNKMEDYQTHMVISDGWANGGEGMRDLAQEVIKIVESGKSDFKPLYENSLPLWEKMETIAKRIYRADGFQTEVSVRRRFDKLQKMGFGDLPVCMAKTQYSFSADPALMGAPRNFLIPVRDVRLSSGAGFIVVLTGDIMTLPGLPKKPSAEQIDIDEDGRIVGLF